MTIPLRLGTRASTLAVTQSRWVADEITRLTGTEVQLVTVTTHGDVSQASLASLGGTGVFASALRDSLLADGCDFVVHSFKDLPTAPHPGLVIAAVPAREDPRDALCARDGLELAGLPSGARIGTGSPRRQAQVLAARPDVTVVDIRGNVDTRLGKVASGELDAVLLAAAGLARIGRSDAVTELLPLAEWPTAAGQGALAIEARDGAQSAGIRAILSAVDDEPARVTATAERLVLAGLEAGCAAPVGVSATVAGGILSLSAAVYRLDGSASLRRSVSGDLGSGGARLAELSGRLLRELFDGGAADLAALGPAK